MKILMNYKVLSSMPCFFIRYLILFTIFNVFSFQELISKDTDYQFNPRDLFLSNERPCSETEKNNCYYISPETNLNPSQQKKDLALLRYALGHAWGPNWVTPYETSLVLTKLDEKIEKSSANLKVEDFCKKIDSAMSIVTDLHSYSELNGIRCHRNPTIPSQTEIGINFAKNSSSPYTLIWKTVNKSKVLILAATKFPVLSDPVYNKLKTDFSNMLINSDSLVIDLRGHSGGDNDVAHFIASKIWGGKAPEYKDRFQIQTPEALALYANRFDYYYRIKNLRLGSLENLKDNRDNYLKDMNDAIAGKLSIIRYIKKDNFLDLNTKDTVSLPAEGYHKPVYVLIDSKCGSAGEDLVAVLEKHPYVTLIGQRTRGVFHFGNQGFLQLPNSRISIWISTTFSSMRDGRVLENRGFVPKILVPAGKDAFKAINSEKYPGNNTISIK